MNKSRKKGKGNKMKMVIKNNDLPVDVLDIIYRELGFDDLFQFSGVCKSWRITHKNHWTNFMESQSPLIVEIATLSKKVCSFLSIPDLKIYRSTMQYFLGFYCGSSSGYLIMGSCDKKYQKLLLMNPFTRRKKEISTSYLVGNLNYCILRSLLAFAKGSEEFVVVVTSHTMARSYCLHAYQSRNSSWVTYSITDSVIDFVVLHNTIYALTFENKIGVLSLNSPRVKFLDLKNTPGPRNPNPRLVTCDGQLLVVNFEPRKILSVYKIDFSTMEYVKLETLGDRAIFYSCNNCYALSNPGRWGYDSNSVYYIVAIHGELNPECQVYSWNNELKKRIARDKFGAPSPKWNSSPLWHDWCFRNQRNEIDYSLVD